VGWPGCGNEFPTWAGWLALVSGALVIISSVLSGRTPPFLIYLLATLPLGVAAALRALVPARSNSAA